MATGRVGGTAAKISGQVGDNIYQIKRRDDGTYVQIIMSKGERTEVVTSPRLQAQRMVTGMVETMMRDLKPVGQISMESGRNKTTSLNAFSSMNLYYVAQDCKANWYDSIDFVYPYMNAKTGKIRDMGGRFKLSAGSGLRNIYNSIQLIKTPQWEFPGWTDNNSNFLGMRFDIPAGCQTIGDYLTRAKISRADKAVFCAFHYWMEPVEGSDDRQEMWRNEYCIASVNATLPDSTPLNLQSLTALFELKTSHDIFMPLLSSDSQRFYIGMKENLLIDEVYHYAGGFSIYYELGKKRITDGQMDWLSSRHRPWLNGQTPADVFGSWMGEPSISPYPNIFQ